jgi:hypothetical protein
MSAKQTVSVQERERRRALDRERLKQAAEQLLSSEGWQRWVRVRGMNGLARYSLVISGRLPSIAVTWIPSGVELQPADHFRPGRAAASLLATTRGFL